MPTHPEAVRLNLEFYRKRAKALLKSAQSGDANAVQRLADHCPNFQPGRAPALNDAQLAVARQQGFASWPRFRAFIIQSALDFQGLRAAFFEAALSDLGRAQTMLAEHPQIAGAGLHAALVLGDRARVGRALDEFPNTVRKKGGPREWEPLVYVCFSRFGDRSSSRAGDLVETARELLRRGADPSATCIHPEWPDNPLSCLYAATGLNNHPALARVLLEAGANPNDSESLYHSTEHADLECMKLLLAHGALPARTNALKHMLDRDDPEGLRLLLETGADPNECDGHRETALHCAVGRGRSAQAVAALLDGGAAIDAERIDGRTAYAMAVQTGQTETAALLEKRGAKTHLSVLDRFIADCATADPREMARLVSELPEMVHSPENERLMPDLAARHATPGIRALLAAGMPINALGELGATALHWACWKGYPDIVELLLRNGASLTIEDLEYHGAPPGWFGHGVHNCPERERGDYAGVARLLIAAGATIPVTDLPTGRADVDAVLREHGLIE